METSIKNRNDAYVGIIDNLTQKEQLVYNLIKENSPCSAFDISERYLIPINEVTGRITGLKNSCMIVEVGSKENHWTKRSNTLYREVKSINERIDLINKKFALLRDKKDKLVNDFNLGLSKLTKEIIKKEIERINKQIRVLENT